MAGFASSVTQVFDLASQLKGLAPQLYVESVLLTELVTSVIQTATLLYSQLEPATLSRFCWQVDAKDKSITAAERLWKTLVLPFVQSATLKDSMIFLKEGDYSHFAPFENSDLPDAPMNLREAVQRPDETFSSFSVNRVMSDLAFGDSQSSLGLQLVDALISCFSRAVNRRLQQPGWKNLGRIIVRDPRTDLALQLCTLSPAVPTFFPLRDMPYFEILEHFGKTSRGYLVHRGDA
jgi:hypothetical protein